MKQLVHSQRSSDGFPRVGKSCSEDHGRKEVGHRWFHWGRRPDRGEFVRVESAKPLRALLLLDREGLACPTGQFGWGLDSVDINSIRPAANSPAAARSGEGAAGAVPVCESLRAASCAAMAGGVGAALVRLRRVRSLLPAGRLRGAAALLLPGRRRRRALRAHQTAPQENVLAAGDKLFELPTFFLWHRNPLNVTETRLMVVISGRSSRVCPQLPPVSPGARRAARCLDTGGVLRVPGCDERLRTSPSHRGWSCS